MVAPIWLMAGEAESHGTVKVLPLGLNEDLLKTMPFSKLVSLKS